VNITTDRLAARVEDGIGWITFNNPERHNALTLEMQRAIPPTLDAFAADPRVRVIVITGAGERAFVSGADISEFGEHRTSAQAREEFDSVSRAAWAAWERTPVPIVAMIRGYCIGGGLLTAIAADIRIAAQGSSFGVPAARLGLGYPVDALEPLVALVGPGWAAELLFSARRVSAEEAQRIGLINRVVAGEELAGAVAQLAHSIAHNAPLTVRAAKAALVALRRPPADRDLARLRELAEACFGSEDYREGQRAFLEKREPRFEGR
jgi:enoyl-CoA hydratase/carnithine racemase